MAFTYRNVVMRDLSYTEGDQNFAEVERLHDEALQARDAAILFARVFDSTTAGLAGSANGEFFAVPGTGAVYLNLYRDDSGVATFITSIGTFLGGTLTGALNEAPPVTIASAATVDIAGAASNTVIVSGTATITALGTIAAGAIRYIRASGAFTLAHNPTSLILYGANIVAAVGEGFWFESLGGGNWRLVGRHYAGPLARTDVANVFASGQRFGTGSGAVDTIIDGGVSLRALRYRTGGLERFALFVSNAAESGSNVGSDFAVARYDDAGAFVDNPATIKRSDGGVYLGTPTGLSKGAGTLNAVNLYVQNSAVLKQADIFVSTDQTITLAGALTLAHGLGTAPRLWQVAFVCTTAELGYSVNDVVSTGSAQIPAMWPDATNLNVRYSNTAVSIAHKTTGVLTAITAANWKARFTAIK